MSTEVDICNLALALLGDDATVASINPPEGSPQAAHCARFYPLARDQLQALAEWSFCTVRSDLALLADPPAYGWDYAYALPTRMARIVEVVGPDDEGLGDYEVESLGDGTSVLYTNTQGARLRYVRQATDASRFPALFSDALTWLLASMVAGPLLKGELGAAASKRCLDYFYGVKLPQARALDTGQRRNKADHKAPWMAGR